MATITVGTILKYTGPFRVLESGDLITGKTYKVVAVDRWNTFEVETAPDTFTKGGDKVHGGFVMGRTPEWVVC